MCWGSGNVLAFMLQNHLVGYFAKSLAQRYLCQLRLSLVYLEGPGPQSLVLLFLSYLYQHVSIIDMLPLELSSDLLVHEGLGIKN